MFEWPDQLKLARELVERDDEVALRTVIYLAYYAIYNSVVAHLLKHGASVNKNDHKGTWNLLRQGRGSKPNFVTRGQYLRELRNRASYDLDFPPGTDLKAESEKAINDAEWMLGGL